MSTPTAPRWTRVFGALVGVAALVIAALSLFAPDLLLGPDAYRSLTRASLGLFAATAAGLGVVALVAARDGSAYAVRSLAWGLLVTAALAPATVVYNIGAFNQTDTSGIRAFSLAGALIVVLGLPSLLVLSVLRRLRPCP